MFTLVPGVGLVQAPSASAFVNAPGGLVQFVIAAPGGTTIPVFRHHYVQQGIA